MRLKRNKKLYDKGHKKFYKTIYRILEYDDNGFIIESEDKRK